MPPFQNNPLNPNPVHVLLRKHPSLFGIPFVLIIVGASFGMQSFAQTRYDLQDQKIQNVTKEQELGLARNRRKFDIREEYFRLNAAPEDGWENKRIPRPAGLPEWGVPPTEPPPKPSSN
ncbi:cytochrome c oxidase assembly protein COX16-domain-containing protein [Phanerochaete sordida]|uniref:Cytochrome c oxidase assembly protein COX16, mitochondrial n=1 Tax=Phanerochaete sordida TaxID=48140 RepID=A0A9P3LLR1_9APHY|nr:cytochrome c oxidase assembly protein COX16-domain-containing protein [Phanerochaete sordida]